MTAGQGLQGGEHLCNPFGATDPRIGLGQKCAKPALRFHVRASEVRHYGRWFSLGGENDVPGPGRCDSDNGRVAGKVAYVGEDESVEAGAVVLPPETGPF